MVAKNDITGDALRSKPTSNLYESNYDNIFRKKPKPQVVNTCPCGGAPSRYCWCPDEAPVVPSEVTPDKPMESPEE